MARLFVGVWIPEDVTETLMSLPRKDQRGVRFVPPDNWHITLRFLGDAPPGDAIAALNAMVATSPHVVLGPAVDVLDERALVVPAGGLDEVATDVVERTRHLGTEKERKRFFGHLTIARVKSNVAMPRALGALIDASFDVTEIALIQSRLHPDGARYETVETFSVG